ncbi:MAG TPA: hypothetical protein PKJ52_09865, partial [Rectinema sp.]|nr:hypothetical protein [Rectinema sp.]
SDGARLERERDELKRQLAEAKLSLTPQEPPEGLVPYGHSLEPTRQNADFWYKAGHSEEAKRKGESVICMAQAVFAWKNAAYAKAEKEMLLENQIAELTEWNNQIGRTNYELRKQLEGEKAAALNYRADALDAEKQLAEHKVDAAKWRAHQKRKQEVIAAGMGRKILRDLETHDALPAFYKEMKKGTTE